MEVSVRKGFSFGLTSGIITTLGLMVGLHSGTHSKLVVLGGILTIAVADAASDALGMHISEESGTKNKKKIWLLTFTTFITKFIVAITFIVPVLLYDLKNAIILSIIWGLALIVIISYLIAKKQKTSPWKAIIEHICLAVAVVVITHYVGLWISIIFSS